MVGIGQREKRAAISQQAGERMQPDGKRRKTVKIKERNRKIIRSTDRWVPHILWKVGA